MHLAFLITFFLIGCAVGSFINVLENRLYQEENWLTLPSHCDFCRKKLLWSDMIPVFSWIWYRGKSRCCRNKLSWQYPVVEFVTGVGFVAIYLRGTIVILLNCYIAKIFDVLNFAFVVDKNVCADISINKIAIEPYNNWFVLIFYLLIFILCFTIFLQDLKYQAIHERLLQLLIVITLIYNFKFLIFNEFFKFQASNFSFLFVGFLSALPFYLLFCVSKERWLGEGDVWLAAWMGFFLGFPKVFWAMYFGLIVGGLISLIVVMLKLKKMRDTISLGPFLLIGTLISLFII